jgi:hypothetical protein
MSIKAFLTICFSLSASKFIYPFTNNQNLTNLSDKLHKNKITKNPIHSNLLSNVSSVSGLSLQGITIVEDATFVSIEWIIIANGSIIASVTSTLSLTYIS